LNYLRLFYEYSSKVDLFTQAIILLNEFQEWSDVIGLLMAQVMGMYFVSYVLLIRMSLPSEYRVIITQVQTVHNFL
jgi:hypothetical protein